MNLEEMKVLRGKTKGSNGIAVYNCNNKVWIA